ncbi:MAG: RimK family alpha-L-glutamate ligase [Clostridiales bacterium]|nr:RimK family alpha-L-glutamate ligase [Clostridiales bacterium]
MKGILVVNEYLRTGKFNEIHSWLLEAADKYGIALEMRSNAEMLAVIGEDAVNTDREADFILFLDKDTRLALYLEKLGYPVFNSSRAIGICDDKALTHLILMNSGIPMPETMIAPFTFENIGYTNYDFLKRVADRLAYPLIVKECFGSFGQQVYLINSYDELLAKMKDIGPKPVIFQRFIKSSFGRDIRLQVVGDKVIAAIYRYSDKGDFRANLTNGAKMKPYIPTDRQCELALQACKLIGLDFAGVDILFGENEEPLVCEVNSNAHFKNIYDCTGINAAEAIIKHIISRIGG